MRVVEARGPRCDGAPAVTGLGLVAPTTVKRFEDAVQASDEEPRTYGLKVRRE